MTATSLYIPDGELFVPTDLVRPPWSEQTSHGGPAAALIVRALERLEPIDLRLAKLTLDILGPIPLVPLQVEAHVVRPGRRVQLAGVRVTDADGTLLIQASAWRIRTRPSPLRLTRPDPPPDPLPPPQDVPDDDFRFSSYTEYYADAQDHRLISGSVAGEGRAAVWFRLRIPVVAGEEPTSEQRVAAAADSANGISKTERVEEVVFINTDLTIHLQRPPMGDWVGMDSVSYLDPSGRGLSDTDLFDTQGYIGHSNQTLFVELPDS